MNINSRDKLTAQQCEALQLSPGDAVCVICAAGGTDGILLSRSPGEWEVLVDGGVVVFNGRSEIFHLITRTDRVADVSQEAAQ